MRKLVYYYVPKKYMEEPDLFQEWNRDNWTEIRIIDSEKIYEKRELKVRFFTTPFVDTVHKLAQFLWELKQEKELLEIYVQDKKQKKKCWTLTIEKEGSLETILDEMSIKKALYVVAYVADGQPRRLASRNGGEALHVWIRKEGDSVIDETLNKWAGTGDFFHYELGE